MAQPYGYLHVVQANQGDALMIEYQSGKKTSCMLIDGGPSQTYKRNGPDYRTTTNVFKLLNDLSDTNVRPNHLVDAIDTVVVTHDDADHKDGIADIFRFLLDKNPPNAKWTKGEKMMKDKEAPIKTIWYNSQASLIENYKNQKKLTKEQKKDWLDSSKAPKHGWFDELLEDYNKKLPASATIKFNAEFSSAPVLMEKSGRLLGNKTVDVSKGPFAFRIKGPDKEDLMEPKLIEELIRSSAREDKRVSDTPATKNGGAGSGSTTRAPSADYSRKNNSSIAFVAIYQSNTGPGANTRLLMLGDAMLTSDILAGEYTIMKIAHHGSSHNNYLGKRKATMNTTKIKVTEGALKQAFAFFYAVRAKNYVISASGTEGWPNPHITTILAIFLATVEKSLGNPNTPAVDLFLTNEIPANALKVFTDFMRDPAETRDSDNNYVLERKRNRPTTSQNVLDRLKYDKLDKYMRIWLLKPDYSYGSIPIFQPFKPDPSKPGPSTPDPSADHWIPFHDHAMFLKATRPQGVGTAAAQVAASNMPSTSGTPPPKRKK